MSRIGALRAVMGAAACVFCLFGTQASADIIDVPGTAPTIESAFNAAVSGDTVRVAPGTYAVNLDYSGKQICLKSSGGAAVTNLMPASPAQPVITCESEEPEGTQLLGFTLTGAPALGPPLINIGLNSSLTVQYCIIRDNPVDNVVVASVGFNVLIRYNIFVRNGGTSCIGVSAGRTNIFNNTFFNNYRGFFTIGGLTRASNNIIAESGEYGAYGSFAELSYNDFWDNNPDYSGGATPGAGNIFADPLFTGIIQDDYALLPESSCIDAGNPDPSFDDPDGTRSDIGGLPLRGYFMPQPVVESATIGTSGDNQHVLNNMPTISWTFAHAWGLPQSAAEIEVGTDDEWTAAELWDPAVIDGDVQLTDYAGLSLEDGESYYARIRVRVDTLWSEWLSIPFRMNSPPSICDLLFPPEDAIMLTCCPTLVVMNTVDPEEDALQYDYLVSLDEKSLIVVASEYGVPSGYGQTDWTVNGLSAENERHWWRARASDGYEVGDWSEPRTFWLDGSNEPPTPFLLRSPVNGEVSVDQQPNFVWEPAADPDPGATLQYVVVVADNPGLLGPTTVYAGEDTTLHWPFLLPTSSQLWWKAITDDGRGATSESSIWSFQVTNICVSCAHQSDFDGDGYTTTIDIGYLVDILYEGGFDPQDPGCAVTRADFDCDGYATGLDLGKLIDYLFAGSAGPCDPCAQ